MKIQFGSLTKIFCLMSTVILILTMINRAEAGFLGSGKPKPKLLETAFSEGLPEYIKLQDFDVEVLENMGSKVDPKWASRFKAIVRNNVPLYLDDENQAKELHGRIQYIVVANPKDSKIEIYGKIYSTVHKGDWEHNFRFDGDLRDFGSHLEDFESDKVIVRGSPQDKEINENLANASTLIQGQWVREKWNKVVEYSIFKENGDYQVGFSQGKNSGDTALVRHGEWSVNGNIVTIVRDTNVKKYSKTTGQRLNSKKWREGTRTATFTIYYIEKNILFWRFKGDSRTYTSRRISANDLPVYMSSNSSNEDRELPKSSTTSSSPSTEQIVKENNSSSDGKASISRKEKINKARDLVANTLESSKIGVENKVTWEGSPLIGVTITGNFKYQNKYSCLKYKVVSYESGNPVTMKSLGKSCRIQGKWYPYIMLSDSSKRSLTGDQFNNELIGSGW